MTLESEGSNIKVPLAPIIDAGLSIYSSISLLASSDINTNEDIVSNLLTLKLFISSFYILLYSSAYVFTQNISSSYSGLVGRLYLFTSYALPLTIVSIAFGSC